MPKPNFFILGAPKCGTTALATYLGEHPQIFMSKPKEPHYFAEDFPGYRYPTSLDDYVGLFAEATHGEKAIGEASVYYLYSKVAVKRIREFSPTAKLLIMLRNPVNMVHSLHAQLLYSLNEDESSFIAAWNAQSERAEGKRIPRYCKDPAMLQYRAIASYTEQINRVFTYFPKKQVKIILFDDFKASAKNVYEDVLQFLDLRSDGRTDFEIVNANHVQRSKFLAVLLRTKPKPLRKLWAITKIVTGANSDTGKKIWNACQRLNRRYKLRDPLTAEVRSMVATQFSTEIDSLEVLLGRSLNSWRHRT